MTEHINILLSRRVAIQTEYYGPTNTKPARIKAWADGRPSIWISYHQEHKPGEDAYDTAAREYCARMEWDENGQDLYRADTATGALFLFMDKTKDT